jgi:uncharacterized protein (DUF1501 family)
MAKSNMSRRNFIRTATCGAMGTTTMMSTLANLMVSNKLIASSANPPSDYKAMVCILLAGGNDSYNMLIPRDNTFYQQYATTRTNLSIPQSDLLDLNLGMNPNQTDPMGRLFGIHPSMGGAYGGLQGLFNSGKAAFVSNVGTLIEPVADRDEYYDSNTNLPLGLYSHSDQIQQWQTATPQSREAIGWGGKIADILQANNPNQGLSMNISLAGRNVFQAGNNTIEYSISNEGNGVEGIEKFYPWYSNSGFLNDIRDNAVKDMATQMYANVFKQTMGSLTSQSLDSLEEFGEAIAKVPEFPTTFSTSNLSQDLRMIAKTIAAKDDLGMCRQTFFVTIGGWDNHDNLFDSQEFNLAVVSNAIAEFFHALDSINMSDNVTLFSISDFARTLTTNGNGSDHAWGGNAIVAGGAVNGAEVYGQFPSLELGDANPLVINNRGNLIPTTSADEYFAELALWFGVSPNDLGIIFPNLSNFYSIGGANPLGFLPPV